MIDGCRPVALRQILQARTAQSEIELLFDGRMSGIGGTILEHPIITFPIQRLKNRLGN
jgi:hypothetical protein